MVSFGDSKRETVKLLQGLLVALPLKSALSAKCTIHAVTSWPLLSSVNLSFIFAALSLCPALERDGLKGSCRKFGLWVGMQGLRHVPCSEGTVCVRFSFILSHILINLQCLIAHNLFD